MRYREIAVYVFRTLGGTAIGLVTVWLVLYVALRIDPIHDLVQVWWIFAWFYGGGSASIVAGWFIRGHPPKLDSQKEGVNPPLS